MFVYQITNKVNGKKYVGQHSGTSLERYWNKTVWHAENGYQEKRALYRAIRKYGRGSFDVETLVIVGTKQEMDYYEIGFIKVLGTNNFQKGYNIAAGGGGTVGFSPDAATRKKMSEAQKGNTKKRGKKISLEARVRISLAGLGREHSQETKAKMSESQRQRRLKERTEGTNTLPKHSKEHNKKIALSLLGSSSRGLRPPNFGRKDSDETRERKSIAAKNRWKKAETNG